MDIQSQEILQQKPEATPSDDGSLIRTISTLKTQSKAYRDEFAVDWTEVEEQLNCIPPDSWGNKEDWQTKIYIPLQAKTSEIMSAQLNKMLFALRRFYSVNGIEQRDIEKEAGICDLFDAMFDKGRFFLHNEYVLHEAIDLGTSFLKVLPAMRYDGIDFSWRSVRNCYPDPMAIVDFSKSRFFMEEYTENIYDIIQNPIYSKDKVEALLAHLAGKSKTTKEDLITIANISGNAELKIASEFQTVTLLEYWGFIPVKKVSPEGNEYWAVENKVINVADNAIVLRDDPNEIGVIPYAPCRVKRNKYHFYGKGFFSNTRGLQELMNSLVNLGFDSLKISSMDIVVINRDAIADASSIQYRPLAVWEMKDVSQVRIQRQPMSAIQDILNGITLIDQVHQEATGSTRHAQGTQMYRGSGSSEETLGEYQLKMQAVEERLLKIAREVEDDYVISILKLVFKIVTNPKLFSQEMANRIIGMKTVEQPAIDPINGQPVVEPTTGFPVMQKVKVPKVVLSEIGETSLDFKPLGLTSFVNKNQSIAELDKLIIDLTANPQLQMAYDLEKAYDRRMQLGSIPDYEDLKRTDEERAQIEAQMQGGMSGGQPPMGGGAAPMQPQQPQRPPRGM